MTLPGPKRWLLAILVAATAAGSVAACGSDDSPTDTDPGPDPDDDVVVVRLTNQATFEPANITIEPGTTVRWEQDSGLFHTITPDGHGEWTEWDTSQGSAFEHTFNTTGTFGYFCVPHFNDGMTGSVTVQ